MESIHRFTLVSSDMLGDIWKKMKQHNADQLLQTKSHQTSNDVYVYYGITNFEMALFFNF